MWWTNTLRTSAEDLGTLAENDPLTHMVIPRTWIRKEVVVYS